MKTFLTLTALFTGLAFVNAQDSGKKLLNEFAYIEADGGSTITIIQSDSDMVIVGSGSIPDQVKTKTENGTFTVRASGGASCTVKVNRLASVTARGASTIKSQNTLSMVDLKITAVDASTVMLDLDATSVTAKVKDASTLKLSGRTTSFDVVSSDGAAVQAGNMTATSVTAVANDASTVTVQPYTSLSARASDASVIKYKGNPTQKNINAKDQGVVKSIDGNNVETGNTKNTSDSNDTEGSFSHKFGDGFIGWGYVLGPDNAGAAIRYGRSREFYMGFGGGYKFFKWNGIGVDIYYKSTDFYLTQDSTKRLPNATLHNAEKISFDNLGGLVFDRFYIGKMYFDGGFYYEWAFYTKHITWDDNHEANSIGSTTKTIDRSLTFANTTNYGLTFRAGMQNGISFYFNYRMTNLFSQAQGATAGPPELPQYTLGIVFGGF